MVNSKGFDLLAFLSEIIFIAAPSLLLLLSSFFGKPWAIKDGALAKDLLLTIIGFCFSIAFFLLTLPRNEFLTQIDDDGVTIYYCFGLILPAILGVCYFISKIIDKLQCIQIYFFWAAVFQFVWCLWGLLKFSKRYSSSG